MSIAARDARIRRASPPGAAPATEEPYVALHSEARWYGNSLWEHLIPPTPPAGKLLDLPGHHARRVQPARHIHTREDEVFLVLESEAWFDIDGERQLVGPRTSVYMPRGVPHTLRVKTPVARMLGIMTPGAFEQLFRNLRSPPASGRFQNRTPFPSTSLR